MSEATPWQLGACAAAEAIAEGRLSAVELAESCLERIAEREPEVRAWAHFDREHLLEQARTADEARIAGAPLGRLHGLPVGIKDIFDTADYPTEDGTPLHAGCSPIEDATAVARLRAAGGLVAGKTVTTELAVYAPGPTRNPHDPSRTPGGSSSGSAAAVAAGMVPLAIGTQTNGSVIRPAAFCGVVGYKPSFGLISRHRVLQQSRWLDQVGVFARDIEDAALLAEALIGHDPLDPDTRPRARPRLLATARDEPPVPPQLGLARGPMWGEADEETREAFAELSEALGERIGDVTLPPHFGRAHEWHRTIMEADLARSFEREYRQGGLSASLVEMIERGLEVRAVDYNEALGEVATLRALLAGIFDHCDALVTPATPGVAPVGLESTGSPVFCTIWTLCGLPAITLPLMEGTGGMPLGVQLVAPLGDDARLLRTARWLVRRLAAEGAGDPGNGSERIEAIG